MGIAANIPAGIKWQSSNENVATINEPGLENGIAAGQTEITARLNDASTISFLLVVEDCLCWCEVSVPNETCLIAFRNMQDSEVAQSFHKISNSGDSSTKAARNLEFNHLALVLFLTFGFHYVSPSPSPARF